jgi:hypothetical protein
MKKLAPFILLMILFFTTTTSFAQIRKIPSSVTDAFKEKYPEASGVEWRDKLSVFTAVFVDDGVTYEARYNSKGQWLSTENTIEPDDIPAEVTKGFESSKYAEWPIDKAYKIQLPNDVVQYRLHVAKTDLQKKNLLYNSKGRLLRDNVTL